jgi:hypothetical protein
MDGANGVNNVGHFVVRRIAGLEKPRIEESVCLPGEKISKGGRVFPRGMPNSRGEANFLDRIFPIQKVFTIANLANDILWLKSSPQTEFSVVSGECYDSVLSWLDRRDLFN